MDKNSSKRLQSIAIPFIKHTKAVVSHFLWPWCPKGRIWAEFRVEIHGNEAKLTISTQIMYFKCRNPSKLFKPIVFLIINVIKVIKSYSATRHQKKLNLGSIKGWNLRKKAKLTILTQTMYFKCPYKRYQGYLMSFLVTRDFKKHNLGLIQGKRRNWQY